MNHQSDEALYIFHTEIYPDEDSVMCSIHDAFGGLEKSHHNCLGCNFADATSWIHNCLHTAASEPMISFQEFYFEYLIKMYLLVERVYVVFELLDLPLEYRGRHFACFQKVHKWANFIKHPKSFLLVHHPSFFMEDDKDAQTDGIVFDPTKYGVIIDQGFVDEYYSGGDKNAKLYRLLTNKTDVAVLFPNIVLLTTEFCECIHRFVRLFSENAVYREVLNSRTTFENYFAQSQDPTATSPQ